MAMVDVTVMGAGAFGLTIAWCCARRGARVRVIDPIGPGAGSSGGLVGALAPHTPENWNAKKDFQFESLIMAEAFWAEIETISDTKTGYGRTGRIQPIMNDRGLELAHARARGAAELWQGKARWDVVSSADIGAWAPQSPTGFFIFDTLSARMHPRMTGAALVAAIRAKGGEILRSGRAEGRVVWATGAAGLLDLSDQMARPIGNGVKGQSALLDFAMPTAAQLFVDGVHVVPHVDGTVAIGSTTERDFISATNTDAQLEDVIAKARDLVPALADAPVIERWAGLRPRAKSRAPMLGHHPIHTEQFIANGGFKIGFGMAPKVGEVMADLVLDGHDTIPNAFRVEASL